MEVFIKLHLLNFCRSDESNSMIKSGCTLFMKFYSFELFELVFKFPTGIQTERNLFTTRCDC